MNPGIAVGAALALGGAAASLLVQRRFERALASIPEDEAVTCDRAAKQALVAVLAIVAVMLIDTRVHPFLGPGTRSLAIVVGALCLNATVLAFRRARASAGLRALAIAAWLASIGMFGGAALFLLSGGRVR